jgi:hypothetical protein
MRVADPADGLVVRLEEVHARLAILAGEPAPEGLTDPDQPTGEQWEAGQAWAHMVEFVPYWIDQAEMIMEAESEQPVPFGRIKTDPDRIAGIEARRSDPVAGLWEQLSEEMGDLKAFLVDVTDDDWRRQGVHQTRGVMDVERLVDEFLVGHLEEHADQLEGLAASGSSTR